jgi:hypothetical protein
MKRVPLNRKTPLTSNAPLKRTEWIKKPTGSQAPRSKQLPHHSKISRRGKEEVQRAKFVADIIFKANGLCVAWWNIREIDYEQARKCARLASEVHEPLTRARGGSILDENNAVAICRICHSWIHEHPREAAMVGLLLSSKNND